MLNPETQRHPLFGQRNAKATLQGPPSPSICMLQRPFQVETSLKTNQNICPQTWELRLPQEHANQKTLGSGFNRNKGLRAQQRIQDTSHTTQTGKNMADLVPTSALGGQPLGPKSWSNFMLDARKVIAESHYGEKQRPPISF